MKSIAGIIAASTLLVASQTAFAQAAPQAQTQPPPSAAGPPGGGMMVPGPTGQPVSGMTIDPAMVQEHMKRMEEHTANMEALLRQLVELQQKK